MSENISRESPLAQFNAIEGRMNPPDSVEVQLCERPFLGHLNLRGDSSDEAFLKAVEGVVGVGLPLEPNTVSENRELTALWLGPNEWLLLTPSGRETGIAEALRDALGDLFAAVTDVSGGQTVINIRGHRARDVLSKGCTLDLHSRVFGLGQCAQSNIAKTVALIRPIAGGDDLPSFDLIVRRSFAEYLGLWLKDAAQEYGVAVIAQPTN